MKKWVKDVIKNGRTFRLTFNKDLDINAWHCLCEEIYHKKKYIFEFTWKKQIFEFYTLQTTTIVERALEKIKNVLEEEEEEEEIIKILNNFVKEGK